MALYLAADRWKDSKYKADADIIIHEMLYKKSTSFEEYCAKTEKKTVYMGIFPMPMDSSVLDKVQMHCMFNHHSDYKVVCFSPVDDAFGDGPTFTDPSYVLPAFYEYFAKYGSEGNEKWSTIAKYARQFLAKAIDNQATGLCADYTEYNGDPKRMVFNPEPDVETDHQYFCWDAWRVPMNIGLDSFWSGLKDADLLQRLCWTMDFFADQGANLGCVYTLDGANVSPGNPPWEGKGLKATVAAASIYRPSAGWPTWTKSNGENIDRLWQMPIPKESYRYYDGCLYLLGFLAASGNLRYQGWKLDLSNVTTGIDDSDY
jgi:oligosaccharide reducing-end xylanase